MTSELGDESSPTGAANPFKPPPEKTPRELYEIRKSQYKFPEKQAKYIVMDPNTYEIKVKSTIRRLKGGFKGREAAAAGTDWDVQMGIFKRYLTENNEHQLRRCFENDWEYMKDVAKKYKKSDEEEIKAEMWKLYKKIK